MLANGDFELVSAGKPAYWEKFGGTLFAGDGARGSYAGCLESDTNSVKWLYQVVPVEPGAWYAASGSGRVSGPGEVSIRVSWYEALDGSGSQLSQDESNVAAAGAWAPLASGPVQAPDSANSARVRLVLRPSGAATACFDDAAFVPVSAPEPTATPSPGVSAPASPTRAGAATATRTPTRPPLSSGGRTQPGGGVQSVVSVVDGPLSLRLSEVMSDPTEPGRDAGFEWVELVNVGLAPLELEGWALSDGTSTTPLPAMSVPATGYVVVAGASAPFPVGVAVVRAEGGQIGNGLGNDGDVIRLVAPDGTVVDEISYGDNTKAFDPPPPAPGAGETLGAIDPAAEPASENWLITLQKTPGQPNVFPPRVTPVAARPNAAEGTTTPLQPLAPAQVDEDDDGGGSIAPWMVLGGLGGVAIGMAGAALWPRIRRFIERRRNRQ